LTLGNAKTVALAYSGGLDSTLIAILLKERYGFERVIPVLVDVGQGQEEIDMAKERARVLGVDVRFIDSKEVFATEYVFRCIKANGSYEGYPVGTSMSRVLIASLVAQVAIEQGAEAVAHGCTGKGNDQFRMESTFRYFAPQLQIVAPVRELNLSRIDEEDMLGKHGIDPKRKRGVLGGDINMWSHSIGSGQVEDLRSQFPEDYFWIAPLDKTPDKPTEVTIEFRNGVPVDVDGIKDPVEMILHLNDVGGRNGIGAIDMMEDGIIGLKSRELYEAPAATVLLTAHADLEHLTLAKEQLRLKGIVDSTWADMVYHGLWLHPLRKDLDAFVDSTQRYVDGILRLRLHKGVMSIVERRSEKSLFAPELRSVKKAGFDQRDSTGAVKIYGVPFMLFNSKGR
jgi:argininosuccinate synthase